MKRIRTMLVLSLILLLAVTASACSGGQRLRSSEAQIYRNDAGYHVSLPDDWQIYSESTESTIFLSADGATSLTLVNELGGEAYYTLPEITEMLLENLEGGSAPWQLERTITDSARELRQLITGYDADGAALYLDLYVAQPYAGIRFYLMFAGGETDYAAQSSLFGDIIKSFAVDEDQVYLYHEMQNRRDAEAAAGLEADDAA